MRKFYLLLSFLYFSVSVFGQIPQTLDSLKIFLKSKPKDSSYVLALNGYANFMVQEGKFDEAIKTINQMEVLSDKIGFGTGFYKAENMRGVIEYTKQKPEKAMLHFLKCNDIIVKYKLPKKIFQNSLNNIGIIYGQLGDRENATRFALQLIDFQEKNRLEPLKTSPYDQIGDNLKFYGKYKEALKYYQKSLDIETKYGNEINMAIGENRMGNLKETTGDIKAAKEHFQKALTLSQKVNYKLLEAEVLINLGRMNRLVKNFKQAEKHLLKSVRLSKELESVKTQLEANQGLGTIYFEQNLLEKAHYYFLESFRLTKEISDPDFIYQANNSLVELYEKRGDFKQAFFYQNQAIAAKDSIFKLETAKNTEDLLRKYEAEKKEQQIALLNVKNEKASLQNKGLVASVVFVILLGILSTLFINNKNKLKRIKESQNIRNKIASDLHDEIGSTLSSILLISDLAKNEEGNSKKMFMKINADSKNVMESMDEIIWSINPSNDSLQEILVRLREFAQPMAISQKMDFEITVDENILNAKLEIEQRRNLYLIIKEAINNLMKYSEAKKASVFISSEKKMLQVVIRDDGKGFTIDSLTSRNGLKNMKERAKDIKADLIIKSSPEKGTKIMLVMPMA